MFIFIVFLLLCLGRRDFFFLSCSAFLLSILTPLFLPSSSVSLSYFIFAVPIRESFGKHACMSSSCPIAILNGTCFLRAVQLQVHNVYSERKTRNSCALVNLNLLN